MKDEIKVAYKMVRQPDPEKPDVFSSYFRCRTSLHYRIGKKTTPSFGPVFLWTADGVFGAATPYYEVDKTKNIFILKCEYVEYPMPWNNGYCDIINPLIMGAVDKADLLLFWTNGTPPKGDHTTMPVRNSGYSVYAKWVKPVIAYTALEVMDDAWIKDKIS